MNIIELLHLEGTTMAKVTPKRAARRIVTTKPARVPREVAQIVFYLVGIEQSQVVRYTDMATAMKQYDKLLEAADHGKGIVLNGSSATCVIRHAANITTAFLVSTELNNLLMAENQKSFNQMMQG